MRVYYIKDNKCIDINKEVSVIGNNVVRVAPIVTGTLITAHVICKTAVIGAGVYGSIKFGEFIGVFPQGIADAACSDLYQVLLNISKLGR